MVVDLADVLTAANLLLTLAVLFFAVRTDLLVRDRGDIDWQIVRLADGVFTVRNEGQDIARGVLVEMWTPEPPELVKQRAKRVRPGESLRITLPRRAAGEMAPLDLPAFDDDPMTRRLGQVGSTDPGVAFLRAQRAQLREEMRTAQVQVRIVWRSGRGRWCTFSDLTG